MPDGLRKLVAARDRRYNTPQQLRATSREITGRTICVSCGRVRSTYDYPDAIPPLGKCTCGGKMVAVWG